MKDSGRVVAVLILGAGSLPLLVDHILASIGGPYFSVSSEAMSILSSYDWPGNVRELQNVLISSVALCGNGQILPEDLPEWVAGSAAECDVHADNDPLLAHERIALESILEQTAGNRRKAAKVLNISEATLYRKLKKTGLVKLK